MSSVAGSFGAGSQLIAAPELLTRLDDPNLRVVDASFELLDPLVGAARYARGHVPGAVHLDLDRDLCGPLGAGGGRHPLPDMQRFVAKLGELGIGRDHEVVVYDQTGGMYAARAWWLLRFAGHERVRFLDGGLAEYVRGGGTLTTVTPGHAATTFVLDLVPGMVATGAEVFERLSDPALVLLDARAPERYRGEIEPIDAKAGHIPGARNLPYTAALDGGKLWAPGQLAARLAAADLAGADVVAYCGSGVSAALLVLALEVAGRPDVRLYPGSWSEWSSDPHRPVATVGPDGAVVSSDQILGSGSGASS